MNKHLIIQFIPYFTFSVHCYLFKEALVEGGEPGEPGHAPLASEGDSAEAELLRRPRVHIAGAVSVGGALLQLGTGRSWIWGVAVRDNRETKILMSENLLVLLDIQAHALLLLLSVFLLVHLLGRLVVPC